MKDLNIPKVLHFIQLLVKCLMGVYVFVINSEWPIVIVLQPVFESMLSSYVNK